MRGLQPLRKFSFHNSSGFKLITRINLFPCFICLNERIALLSNLENIEKNVVDRNYS